MARLRSSRDTRTERKTLSDMVFNQIYRSIKSGSYSPDEKLPPEVDLAAEFEVSRPVIREALKKLREQNLIYSKQGVGSFVRQNGIKDPLGFSPVENLSDLRRCYEFREVLEPACAAAAAERRTESDLVRIEKALLVLKDATNKGRHHSDADYEFHLSIAQASGNQYFLTAMESLKEHISVGMKHHGHSVKQATDGLDNVFHEHEQIFAAIRDRDPESAKYFMREHIMGSRTRILDH